MLWNNIKNTLKANFIFHSLKLYFCLFSVVDVEDSSHVPIPFPKRLSFSFSNPAFAFAGALGDFEAKKLLSKGGIMKGFGSKVKRLSTRKSKSGSVFLGEISGVSSLCKDSSSSDAVRTSRSQMATTTISVVSKSGGSSEVPESCPGSPLPSSVLSASVESSTCKEGGLSGMKVRCRWTRILCISDKDSDDCHNFFPNSSPSLRTVSAMVHSSNISGELSDPEISFKTTVSKGNDVDVEGTATTMSSANLATCTEDSTS